jgi:type I site-specific restriction-modification system R (restriction) subunit
MIQLNLPQYNVKISIKCGKSFIYDPLRRKDVVLTPEEWVRQHFVNFLITDRFFQKELIANEVTINMNGMSKRCDTVVYDNFLAPVVIIEYKAPEINITEQVFDQIAKYNSVLKVPYLIVSNGFTHYCCAMDYQSMNCNFLKEIPTYSEIKSVKNEKL